MVKLSVVAERSDLSADEGFEVGDDSEVKLFQTVTAWDLLDASLWRTSPGAVLAGDRVPLLGRSSPEVAGRRLWALTLPPAGSMLGRKNRRSVAGPRSEALCRQFEVLLDRSRRGTAK